VSVEPVLSALPNLSPVKNPARSVASFTSAPSSNTLSVHSPLRGRAASNLAPPTSSPSSSLTDLEPTADSSSLPAGHPEAPVINCLTYDKFQSQLMWSDSGSNEKENSATSFSIIIRDVNTNSILGKPAVASQSPLSFKLHTLILNANALGHIIQVSVQAINNLNGGSVSAKSNLMQFTAGSFGTFNLGDPQHDMGAPGAVAVSPASSATSRISVSTGISPLLARQARAVASINMAPTSGASSELMAAFAKKSLRTSEAAAALSQAQSPSQPESQSQSSSESTENKS
jgi:hypothetical protein